MKKECKYNEEYCIIFRLNAWFSIFISVSYQSGNYFSLINGSAYVFYFRIQRVSEIRYITQATEVSQFIHLKRKEKVASFGSNPACYKYRS